MKRVYISGKTVKRLVIIVSIIMFLLGVYSGILLNDVFAKEEPGISATSIPDVTPTEITEVVEKTNTYYDCPLGNDLQDYIRELCEQNDLPMSLVLAVIENESSFKADVISADGGDYGLMQINKINHQWLSDKYNITDFLNPYQNVLCGITILGEHYRKYGDFHKSLMAYNMGSGGASKLWKEGIYTSKYSNKVMLSYDKYERS